MNTDIPQEITCYIQKLLCSPNTSTTIIIMLTPPTPTEDQHNDKTRSYQNAMVITIYLKNFLHNYLGIQLNVINTQKSISLIR